MHSVRQCKIIGHSLGSHRRDPLQFCSVPGQPNAKPCRGGIQRGEKSSHPPHTWACGQQCPVSGSTPEGQQVADWVHMTAPQSRHSAGLWAGRWQCQQAASFR